ncbi:hypothetical protein GCM10028805_22520 [Spirosoma harenae]
MNQPNRVLPPHPVPLTDDWSENEFDRFRAVVKRIYDSSWWTWTDMQEMETCIPGLTERLAITYGVTIETFEMILSNGKGYYLTPELKEDFYKGFYYE